MTKALRYLLIVGGAVGGILLFLLASASENSSFLESNYKWLLGINILVAAALLGLVVLLLARLYHSYQSGQFGSKLMTRLVLLFAMMGILPGAVIYMVSVQFVSRSIESWFDVRVEAALESGIKLGRSALDASLADLNAKAQNIANELADLPDSAQITLLSRLHEQSQFQEAVIVSANGRIVSATGKRFDSLAPDLPSANMLRQARLQHGFSIIEGGGELQKNDKIKSKLASGAQEPVDELRLRVIVMIPPSINMSALQAESHFLQLLQPVSNTLGTNAEALRVAYSEYQARSVGRVGLRKIYIVTLTLTLLLAIFGAIGSAFMIANNFARPLLLLAEGTRAVAGGDLSPRPIIATKDELGTLTQSFNTMTRQLFDARSAVEMNRAELENAKVYLESVLANMSAGVMVLDREFTLITCNASVGRILQHDFAPYIDQPLATVEGLSSFANTITKAFSEQSAASAATFGQLHWQLQIEIPRRIGDTNTDHDITLLTRGSRLPVESGTGYILMFDDISDLISAQRSIAWGEVARRLAHEIKNPLTPIQLSAERLQMKLESKLAGADLALLNKGTATIVSQVSAMKRMVDDFRDYAKTPPAVLLPLELNSLIEEVLHLYIAGDERDIVRARLASDLPQIMGDATQLRQVIHNLLQNAQDAMTDQQQNAPGTCIDVLTETIHYPNADGEICRAVRFSVADNGAGFAPNILARAFEPYVTSKQRGTGLGLAMVKKIIDEHGGRIDIHNRVDVNGAEVSILLLKLATA